MKLMREEQETYCWTNAASDEWEIYTADPKFIRKFDKIGYPSRVQGFGKRYKVPLRTVRFGRMEKRAMSDAQRAAAKQALLGKRSSQTTNENESKSETGIVASPES